MAAAKSINAVGEELVRHGVKFAFGAYVPILTRVEADNRAGQFKAPILDKDGACVGVEAVDGSRYLADKVVLAAGAWTPTLVDLEDQCVSKAWVYAHLQLTPEEAKVYKGCPVVYNGDYGFFFEPNE